MDYESATAFAASWGLLYFGLLFVGVCIYAFWPRNKDKFEKAARVPLEKDER